MGDSNHNPSLAVKILNDTKRAKSADIKTTKKKTIRHTDIQQIEKREGEEAKESKKNLEEKRRQSKKYLTK